MIYGGICIYIAKLEVAWLWNTTLLLVDIVVIGDGTRSSIERGAGGINFS